MDSKNAHLDGIVSGQMASKLGPVGSLRNGQETQRDETGSKIKAGIAQRGGRRTRLTDLVWEQ